jgi:hypothetical protein
LILCIKLFLQSEIIVQQTPGMPSGVVIEKSSWDKRAQQATLLAVTNAIASINPANADYQRQLLQVFLAPSAFTRISLEIDDRIKKLTEQRELGSYYFVWRAYDYDSALDRHFVTGDVHTVNAAHDTPEAYVFEYQAHVENYRLVVDTVSSYPGDRPHDSGWIKEHRKPQ